MCDGLVADDVALASPKFHEYPLMVAPFGVDELVNVIGSPRQTEAGAENDATGVAFTVIRFVCVDVLVQLTLLAVNVTE